MDPWDYEKLRQLLPLLVAALASYQRSRLTPFPFNIENKKQLNGSFINFITKEGEELNWTLFVLSLNNYL